MTPQAYFEFEKNSETRHEYFNGQISDIPEADSTHALISANKSNST